MAISNTSILVKRSTTTATPGTLKPGEIAYSYLSNTFFIGNSTGTGVINIGGSYYTSSLDTATSANVAGTIVKRDVNGAFAGQLYGNANTATTLLNAQNFSISGSDITASAVSFNGSSGVTLNASLNSVAGLSAGYYGGSTTGSSVIPVIQVAANGRIMSISNTSVSTDFFVSDGTNSNTVYSGSTLKFIGNTNSGITTSVNSNETVYFGVDSTLVRSNTSGGPQTIGTDLNISGNLIVRGTQSYINSATFDAQASLLELAANNYVGDVIDIGFYGVYNNGTQNNITGLVRDAGSKNYYLFTNINYTGAVAGNVISNNYFTSSNTATLYTNLVANQANATTANITSATIGSLTLTSPLPLASGGTGSNASGFSTAGQRIIYNGSALVTQANTTTTPTGSLAANNTITALTYNSYGELTGYTGSAISGLTVGQGGTGQSSFSSGQIIVGNGTGGLAQIANVTTAVTGSLAANNTITSFTTDAWGRVTAYTGSAISGLTVGQGGTGQSSFTASGIIYGNGTAGLGVTAAAGTSDQTWSNQIMTVTNAGVPVWSTALDGGQF